MPWAASGRREQTMRGSERAEGGVVEQVEEDVVVVVGRTEQRRPGAQ